MKSMDSLFADAQAEFHYSDYEIAKIRYILSAFFMEGTKILILLCISFLLGYTAELAAAILVLLSIRTMCGGLHFQHYWSCFAFTLAFFILAIGLPLLIDVPYVIQIVTLLLSLIILLLIGPITSENRPKMTDESFRKFKYVSSAIIAVYLFCFLIFKTLPYQDICYWVLVLQILQLATAKIIKLRKEKNHEKINII